MTSAVTASAAHAFAGATEAHRCLFRACQAGPLALESGYFWKRGGSEVGVESVVGDSVELYHYLTEDDDEATFFTKPSAEAWAWLCAFWMMPQKGRYIASAVLRPEPGIELRWTPVYRSVPESLVGEFYSPHSFMRVEDWAALIAKWTGLDFEIDEGDNSDPQLEERPGYFDFGHVPYFVAMRIADVLLGDATDDRWDETYER